MNGTPDQVAGVLEAAGAGDARAAEQLLPLLYDELRRLAAAKMAHEPAGHTLQPTALVHETWLKLTKGAPQGWQNRAHFFAAAAEAMRRILVDVARRKQQIRHGGGQQRVDVDSIEIAFPEPSAGDQDQFLQVNEALNRLAALDPVKAEVVKLRFFVGLTNAQVAELRKVSERTVERDWGFAKAWLFAEIRGRPPPERKTQ
ncbi:MAG: ECF-type sigma factor [Limisphaerales bacterium]